MNIIENNDELLPLSAYLYFPKEDEEKIGQGSHAIRRIFEGQVTFDNYENQILVDFHKMLARSNVSLNSWWTEPNVLRFLYANQFKFEKALKSIQSHTEWRLQKIPPKLDQNVQSFLDSGVMYVHGRDHRFRPVVIFNAYKLNIKDMNVESILDSVTYFLHFVIEYLMLPGQIENWVFIIDLNHMGVSSLPISLMKKVMGYMQNNFRSRLFSMYIVNAPKAINMTWSLIKGFLDKNTTNKIKILAQSFPEALFTHCSQKQIEKRFGGLCRNIEADFWPPRFPNNQYFLENENQSFLMTKDAYQKAFHKGLLTKNIVCRELLEEEVKKDEVKKEEVKIDEIKMEEAPVKSIVEPLPVVIVKDDKEDSVLITEMSMILDDEILVMACFEFYAVKTKSSLDTRYKNNFL